MSNTVIFPISSFSHIFNDSTVWSTRIHIIQSNFNLCSECFSAVMIPVLGLEPSQKDFSLKSNSLRCYETSCRTFAEP